MEGYDDGLSEVSSESSYDVDDPPSLDETIFDMKLFALFRAYMVSQQVEGNLMFLRDARIFHMYKQPRPVLLQEATRIVMSYLAAYAPLPVSISDEMRKKMTEITLDTQAELTLSNSTFSPAYSEVYNVVLPHFRNWIATNEWRDCVPFHHLPPPTFDVVLKTETLRALFNKYLKSQAEHDEEGSIVRLYHLWKFCIIVNDFRNGDYSHTATLESKKRKKKNKGEESTESLPGAKKEESEPPKQLSPEEYAKKVYKKYKHIISLHYDKTMPHAVFIGRALDRAVEDFERSKIFQRWLDTQQYQGVDFQAKIVHQTQTPDGFTEPPTLAAVFTSTLLPVFLNILQNCEQGSNLRFLRDILAFHENFKKFETTEEASGSAGSSDSSKKDESVTRKKMVEEAKNIYSTYLEKGDMYCDPGLVEEVHNLITKSSGKNVVAGMFRKCGAFIYHRSERTWCREARATLDWVSHSYDNRSKNTRRVEEEFSLKNLPDDFDLQILPSIDDIYGNALLFKDYGEFVNSFTDGLFDRFLNPFEEYFECPIHERKAALEKLLGAFTEAGDLLPELSAPSRVISKEIISRERVSDVIVVSLFAISARAGAATFYKKWIVDHSMVWKTASWSTLPEIRLGDLSLLMGMSQAENQIEEAALKGKSGFSRYLAKRQVKKQNIAAVRQTVGKPEGPAKSFFDIVAGASVNKSFQEKANAFIIPSIDLTLSSPFLRKMFELVYLENVLGTSEMSLWEGFCTFLSKYDNMSNEQLCDGQEELLNDILAFCDRYKGVLPKYEEIKERAKKQKILFPNFFRPLEIELFGTYHAGYETLLRKNGWK